MEEHEGDKDALTAIHNDFKNYTKSKRRHLIDLLASKKDEIGVGKLLEQLEVGSMLGMFVTQEAGAEQDKWDRAFYSQKVATEILKTSLCEKEYKSQGEVGPQVQKNVPVVGISVQTCRAERAHALGVGTHGKTKGRRIGASQHGASTGC